MSEDSILEVVVRKFVDSHRELEPVLDTVIVWAGKVSQIAQLDTKLDQAALSGEDRRMVKDELHRLRASRDQFLPRIKELVDVDTLSDLLDAIEQVPEGNDADARSRHPTAQPAA